MESKMEESSLGGVEILENKQKNLEKIRENIVLLKEDLMKIIIEEGELKKIKSDISEKIAQEKEELIKKIKELGAEEKETDEKIEAMLKEAMRQIDELPESTPQELSDEDRKAIRDAYGSL